MVHYNGKFYITCYGGAQFMQYGNIWSVAVTDDTLTPKFLIDTKDYRGDFVGDDTVLDEDTIELAEADVTYLNPENIAVDASTGKMAITLNVYKYEALANATQNVIVAYFPTAAQLDSGTLGDTKLDLYYEYSDDAAAPPTGWGNGIAFAGGVFWIMGGNSAIAAFGPDGAYKTAADYKALEITGKNKGFGYYSITALPSAQKVFVGATNVLKDGGATNGGTAYLAYDSDTQEITATGSATAPYGTDIGVFCFKNGTSEAVLLNERLYNADFSGKKNNNFVYLASDLGTAAEIDLDARNVHGAASTADGKYLYLACYENIADQSSNAGEFVRVDLTDGYVRDKNYDGTDKPEPKTEPTAEVVEPAAPSSDTSSYQDGVAPAAASDITTYDAATFTDVLPAASAIKTASFDVTEDGAVMKPDAAMAIISSDASLVDPASAAMDKVTPLPTFSAKVDNGKTVVIGIEISGDKMLASESAGVKVAKIRADGTAHQMYLVTSKAALTDGTYTIYDKSGGRYADKIEPSGTYVLNIAITDGGSNDVDGKADGSVLDPLAFYSVTPKSADPSSSSSGACSMGFGLAALAAAVTLRRRG